MNREEEYSINSRELCFKHSVTQDPECELFYMHAHNLYELLYFVSGDATVVIEDKKYKLKKGDLALIRPLKYHYVQIDSPAVYERYDILFDERAFNIDNTAKIEEDIEIIDLTERTIACDIIKKLDYYSERLTAEDFNSITVLLIKELFYYLSIKEKNDDTKSRSAVNPTLTKALRYINENIFSLRSIKEVADEIFVTESYLFRLFKNELKKSPKKYINDKRLLAAQSLIQMGELPSAVFERCGFSDYTSFYRNYKEYFGYPPSMEKEY